MRRLKLVKPQDATGKTKKIYQEIEKLWGKNRLVPVFGFWGRDPDILEAMWTPLRKYEHDETLTDKEILVGACLVGANQIGCERCINFHAIDLSERLNISDEKVKAIRDFENSYKKGLIKEKEYVAYSLAKALTEGSDFSEEKWEKLTSYFTDEQIYEIIVITLVEVSFARYGMVMAGYDQSYDWPDEYRPSGAYSSVMAK